MTLAHVISSPKNQLYVIVLHFILKWNLIKRGNRFIPWYLIIEGEVKGYLITLLEMIKVYLPTC